MKKSIAESKKDFIPKAAMPRIWWVIENNLTPSREGWQRIRPLINRFFSENPVLLREVLSYVFQKTENDLIEEVTF